MSEQCSTSEYNCPSSQMSEQCCTSEYNYPSSQMLEECSTSEYNCASSQMLEQCSTSEYNCASSQMLEQCSTSEYNCPSADENMHTLFPAYANKTILESTEKKTWTENSSFLPHLISANHPNQSSFSPVLESEISEVKKQPPSDKEVKNVKKDCAAQSKSDKAIYPSSRETYSSCNRVKKLMLREKGLSIENIFCTDVRSDPENQIFGCPDKKHVSKFICYVKTPLGMHPNALLESEMLKKKKVKRLKRYFNPVKSKKDSVGNETVIKPKQNFEGISSDFIPLDLSSTKLNDWNLTFEKKSCEEVSENWKLNFNENAIKSTENIVSSENLHVESLAEKDIQIKILSFNRSLKDDPQNEQSWLALVALQSDLVSLSCYKNSSSLEHIIIEKKLAILEKALTFNPNSVCLMLAKLELCKGLWETEEMISSWKQMLFLHPYDIRIWKEYLLFMLADSNNFTVPHIFKQYRTCLRKLLSMNSREFKSHQSSSSIFEHLLDIISHLCHVLGDAGHIEQAVAIFQALIEFNLCASPLLDSVPSEQCIALFESFWDSGVPRFGEDNAVGWNATATEKKMCSSKSVNHEDLTPMEDDILKWKYPAEQTWLEFEKLRESFCWLPWRPNTDLNQTLNDSEDQCRIISYEDVSGLLFRLPEENLKFILLCKFLSFLGVNLHLMECSYFTENTKGVQIVSEVTGTLSSHLSNIINQKEADDPFKLSLFSRYENLPSFINNVFQQAKCLFSSEYNNILSLLQLRYLIEKVLKCPNGESSHEDINGLRKMAKDLLKPNYSRNCLFIWTEYLFIEWMSNKKVEAEKIFENLLMMGTNIQDNDKQDNVLFYFARSYIEFFIGITDYGNKKRKHDPAEISKIVWALSNVGSKQKYSKWYNGCYNPSLVLKAVAGFKAEIGKQLSSVTKNVAFECKCLSFSMFTYVDCSVCLIYLLYFTKGMEAARQAFDDIVGILSTKCQEISDKSLRTEMEEPLFVSFAYLLNFHSWNSADPLSILRLFLFEAIEKFPNNACLLHLLTKMKSASSIVCSGRRFFDRILSANPHLAPVTWLYSIASELSICYSIQEPFSSGQPSLLNCGFIPKIRSQFDKALQSQNSKHCAYVWRAYCKFEVMLGDTVRAKKIIIQSLQHCVWSKVLFMDAIKYFPDDLDYFLKIMSEKQLRIRTPLAEIMLLTKYVTMDVT